MKYGLPALCVLWSVWAVAADETATSTASERAKMRVSLAISGDPALVHETRSHLAKALRNIPDVEISDAQPVFKVVCIVGAVVGSPEKRVLALTTSTSIRAKVAETAFAEKLTEADRMKLRQIMGQTGTLEDSMLAIEDVKDLEAACDRMIASLDGRTFEKARTMVQEMSEGRFKYLDAAKVPTDLRKDDVAPIPDCSVSGVR